MFITSIFKDGEQTGVVFFFFNKKNKQRNTGDHSFKVCHTEISTAKLCLYINSSLILQRNVVISYQQSNHLEKV